jgi:Anti-sigma-28 factor, FlgM
MSDLASIVPVPGSSPSPGILNGFGSAGSVGSAGAVGSGSRAGAAGSLTGANATPAVDLSNRLADLDVSSSSATGGDRVEVSDFARYLDQLRRLPDVRPDRIAAARQAIAQGAYDSEDVLNITIDRMSEEEF